MSTSTEDRLRAALHATAQEHVVEPGAWARNRERLHARRRRSAAAGLATAAAVVVAATAGALALRSGPDTVDFAGPSGAVPASPDCGGDACPPGDDRSSGPVLDTVVVDGERFDLRSRDGDDAPFYAICTSTGVRQCGQLPAYDPYTSFAVPSARGGAVLFLGGTGTLSPVPGDRLVVSADGSDTGLQPPVTFLRTRLLDYDIAAVRMPEFAPVFCVSIVRPGLPRNTIAVSGVVNAPGNCADAPTG
jgi:hypothetical protein